MPRHASTRHRSGLAAGTGAPVWASTSACWRAAEATASVMRERRSFVAAVAASRCACSDAACCPRCVRLSSACVHGMDTVSTSLADADHATGASMQQSGTRAPTSTEASPYTTTQQAPTHACGMPDRSGQSFYMAHLEVASHANTEHAINAYKASRRRC
jgi:hypothetical protein